MRAFEAVTATRYEVVVGLEVHAQVLTQSKMFCSCSTDYLTTPPNANTCPVCLGLPGALPVINRRAVEATIRTALALNCEIPGFSKFDRKNYFYPDLPKGYQISQYDLPFSRHGHLDFDVKGEPRRCGITRVHLEEDTGKLLHAGAIEEAQSSLVDFNRAGVPLMEIVSEPDLRSADEAREYVVRLRAILQYIGVNNGDMEPGPVHHRLRPHALRRLAVDLVEADGRLLRGNRRAGGSRQVGRELDPQRLQPAAQCRPQGDRTVVDQAYPPAAADRTHRVGHDQREDGEGDLRGDVPGIRSGAGARGVEGLEPDQRRRRA